VTKARACKVEGQKGNMGVTLHAPKSVGKCEGMNLHTPKGASTLGVGFSVDSRWIPESLESDCRGQNPLD